MAANCSPRAQEPQEPQEPKRSRPRIRGGRNEGECGVPHIFWTTPNPNPDGGRPRVPARRRKVKLRETTYIVVISAVKRSCPDIKNLLSRGTRTLGRRRGVRCTGARRALGACEAVSGRRRRRAPSPGPSRRKPVGYRLKSASSPSTSFLPTSSPPLFATTPR